jgi:hypothetical protein
MTNTPHNTTPNSSDTVVQRQQTPEQPSTAPTHVAQNAVAPNHDLPETLAPESGGQAGLDPTRYGDWEKKGRCTDF